MRIAATLLLAAAVVGCSGSKGSSTEGAAQPLPPPTRQVIATVEGTFDGRSLTFRPIADAIPNGLVEIPVVQDGTPGTNPPDTVEMVTESMVYPVADGCGAGVFSLDALVTVRSFFTRARLDNVYFEITDIPTGYEACNSATPAPPGTSNQFGLFPYWSLWPISGSDWTWSPWRLRLPNQAPFTFRGRIVADVVVDDEAPYTYVSPVPGRTNFPVWLNATCVEANPVTACMTFYTLDGSEPTTASTLYTTAIEIDQTTTVKIFSVDQAGNAEPVQTLEYVIDTEPPRVVATTPAPGTWTADAMAPVTVTFSEPVDPNWTSVSLNDGECFVPDPDLTTWSCPASYYGFGVGSVMRIRVQGALDLAGNPMLGSYEALVAIGGTPELQASSGQAYVVNQDLSSNGRGDLLAVWTEETGAANRLYAMHRLAGQAWGSPLLLEEGLTTSPFHARLADSADFLVVWSGASATWGALIDGTTGQLRWKAQLWAGVTDRESLALRWIGDDFVVARTAEGAVEIIRGSRAGTLGIPEHLAGYFEAKWPRIARAPSGTLYVFHVGDDALRFVKEDGAGAWFPSEPGPSGYYLGYPPAIPPVVFDTAVGVELVWADPSGYVLAAEDTGLGFGPAVELWSFCYPSFLAGGGAGDVRAVVWDPDYSWALLGAIHQNGAWGPTEWVFQPATPAARDPSVTEDLDVVAVRGDALLLKPVVLPGDGVLTWYSALEWTVNGSYGAFPPREPRSAGTGSASVTAGQSAEDPYYSGTADALWFATESVPDSWAPLAWAHPSREAFDVSAAVSLNGQGATWTELGSEGSFVFARGALDTWMEAPAWYPNSYLDPSPRSDPHVVAAGAVLNVMVRGPDPANWTYAVDAMPIASGIVDGFGSPPELDTAGSLDFLTIAWSECGNVGALSYSGAWTSVTLQTATMCTGPSYPSAAAAWYVALVGWRGRDGSPRVADAFGSVPAATFPATLGPEGPVVALGESDASGYPRAAVAWHAAGAIYAAVEQAGTAWAVPVQVSPPATSCNSPRLASDGATFLAVFECGTELRASRFDGTTWSAPFLVTTDPLAWSLAGAPSGYRVALVHEDWDGPHAFQIKINGTTAELPTRIDTEPGAVRPRIRLNADVGFFCAGWSQVVDDPFAAQPRARCFL